MKSFTLCLITLTLVIGLAVWATASASSDTVTVKDIERQKNKSFRTAAKDVKTAIQEIRHVLKKNRGNRIGHLKSNLRNTLNFGDMIYLALSDTMKSENNDARVKTVAGSTQNTTTTALGIAIQNFSNIALSGATSEAEEKSIGDIIQKMTTNCLTALKPLFDMVDKLK